MQTDSSKQILKHLLSTHNNSHYAIQVESILYNRNGGSRAHEENQFKNRNIETSYRQLTKNIREKPIEGNYENRYFH